MLLIAIKCYLMLLNAINCDTTSGDCHTLSTDCNTTADCGNRWGRNPHGGGVEKINTKNTNLLDDKNHYKTIQNFIKTLNF